MPPDDIKDLPSATPPQGSGPGGKPVPASPPARSIGLESEVRGGPEAPDDDLDETTAQGGGSDT